MANAFSIIHKQQPYIQAVNVSDIEKTMAVKQNNFDYNMAQVNQAISQFSSIDLARDQDKLHLYQNMKKVLDIVGNTDNIDFSKTGVGSELSTYISKAIDRDVIKHAGITQKMKRFNAKIDERRQKGEISEENYNYALHKAGYAEYMNGESDDLGNLVYHEYSDVYAEQLDFAKKLKEVYKDYEEEIMDPRTGLITKRKVSALTQPEMQAMLNKSLNAQQRKQLEINGSYLFGHDPQKAQMAIKGGIEDYKKKAEETKKYLIGQRDMETEGSEEREALDRSIAMVEQNVKEYTENMLDMKTPEQIGAYLLREQMTRENSIALTREFLLSEKYDTAWVKMMQEADEKAKRSPQSDVSTITAATALGDEINVLKKTKEAIATFTSEHQELLTNSFDSLPDNQKELITQTMESIKQSDEVKKAFPNGVSNEVLQRLAIEKVGYKVFDPATRKALLDSINKMDSINKKELRVIDDYLETNVMDKEMFEQTFDEERQMVIFTPDGNQTTMGEMLRENGVKDYETYRRFIKGNSREAQIFKGNIALQSMSLSEGFENDLHNLALIPAAVRAGTMYLNNRDTSTMHLMEGEYKLFKKSIELLTGENIEDIYEISEVTNRGVEVDEYGDLKRTELKLKDPNSKFAKIAEKTQSARIEGGGFIRTGDIFSIFKPDQTIGNERSVEKLFSEKRYNEAYEKSLGAEYATLPGNSLIRIMGAEKKENVNQAIIELIQHTSNTDINTKNPVTLSINDDGSLTIYQTKRQGSKTNSKGELVDDQAYTVGVVSAADIHKMPHLLSLIEMEKSKVGIEDMANLQAEVTSIGFVENNTGVASDYQKRAMKGLNDLYSKDIPAENLFRHLSTKETAEKALFTTDVKALLAKSPEGGEIEKLFEDMTTNTGDYKLSLNQNIDGDYSVTVSGKQGAIDSISLSQYISPEIFSKAYNGTPQVFLGLIIEKKINEYREKLQYAAR